VVSSAQLTVNCCQKKELAVLRVAMSGNEEVLASKSGHIYGIIDFRRELKP